MPSSAVQRGSAGPLPARRKLCFRRQSASSTAAVEPGEDEPKAMQRSCSEATASVRFLIPRPTRPATEGARWPCPRRPRRSRRSLETTPQGARYPSHCNPKLRRLRTLAGQSASASALALPGAHPESPAPTGSHLREGQA